jgi:hypothetical protein
MTIAKQSERLFFVHELAGFLPGSFDELFAAEGILLSEGEGGVAGHLGEIMTHQDRLKRQLEMSSKEEEVRRGRSMNPETTARAVVRRYISYYRSAQVIGRSLNLFNEDVKLVPNPKLSLGEEINPHQSGAKALLQYMELRNLVQTPPLEVAVSPLEINYFGHSETEVEYIESLAGKATIAEVRVAVVAAIANHQRRQSFWRSSLGELEDSRVVGSLVTRALTTA